MVENDEIIDATDVSRLRYLLVWFAKALDFLRIFKKAYSECLDTHFFHAWSSKDSSNRESGDVEEFCLVQYLKFLSVDKVKWDRIYKTLGYVFLRLNKTSDEPE